MCSNLCLGTVQFGMRYGVNNALGRQPTIDECYEIISCAVSAGIDTFDTAHVYGNAENILGTYKWKNLSPKFISKLPPECDGDEFEVIGNIKDICRRLRSNHLYGCLIHRAKDIEKESVLLGLKNAKKQGLVSKIGISVYNPDEAILATKSECIDIIQVPYNVLDRRLDKVDFFEFAKKNNKLVYVRSSFLQGLLLMSPCDAEERVKGSGILVEKVQRVSRCYGYTTAELSLLYCLCHSGIDYVIFGVDNVAQLKYNLLIKEKKEGFWECYNVLKDMFYDVPQEIIVPSLWK